MNWHKKQAFTLVELIVVITILAILWTIAFISLQWYSTQARDSMRISDMWSMKSSLELVQLEAGKYPLPTGWVNITYSWATVWSQGTFWETVYSNVGKLDKIPTDPLTDKQYTYSVTATRNQYQLWGMVEGDEVVIVSPGITQTNAWETIAKAYITWNYNGQMTKSLSWTTCNALVVPSIIANDTTVTDLQQIITGQKLVFSGYKNLPASFTGSKFKADGWFAFTPNNLLAYSDTGSCSPLTDNSSYTARVNLLKGLQDSYSGTLVKNEGEIKNILALNINTSSPSNDVINYAGNFVNNILWGRIIVGSSNSSSSSSSSGWLIGWMVLDSNCDIPDITIGSQVWAWCNSTLWTWFERWKQDNGTNGTIWSCYDYNWNNTATCTIWSTAMASNTKANTWYTGTNVNWDTEYPAIWWKLYTWTNSPSACPTWWHVPTDTEWTTLENYFTANKWDSNIWWSGSTSKNNTNNIVQALKIPLAGVRNSDGFAFYNRGHWTNLWSSTPISSFAYNRQLYWGNSIVNRWFVIQAFGYSVRCLKD